MDIVDIETFVTGDILVENEFLENVERYDWSQYLGKMVLIRGCSDIIIPTWAYMSVTAKLVGVAKKIRYGNEHSNLVIWRSSEARAPKAK